LDLRQKHRDVVAEKLRLEVVLHVNPRIGQYRVLYWWEVQ